MSPAKRGKAARPSSSAASSAARQAANGKPPRPAAKRAGDLAARVATLEHIVCAMRPFLAARNAETHPAVAAIDAAYPAGR